MKVCKNCGSSNNERAEKCTTCYMSGMLVMTNSKKQESPDTIKSLFKTCNNCGTKDNGNAEKCIKCNFPISKFPKGIKHLPTNKTKIS